MVVRTVLHEYTHYLHNLLLYHNVLSKVGYEKHPQELEARGMEKLYSVCWNEIKKAPPDDDTEGLSCWKYSTSTEVARISGQLNIAKNG
jgi:hypothetical protein